MFIISVQLQCQLLAQTAAVHLYMTYEYIIVQSCTCDQQWTTIDTACRNQRQKNRMFVQEWFVCPIPYQCFPNKTLRKVKPLKCLWTSASWVCFDPPPPSSCWLCLRLLLKEPVILFYSSHDIRSVWTHWKWVNVMYSWWYNMYVADIGLALLCWNPKLNSTPLSSSLPPSLLTSLPLSLPPSLPPSLILLHPANRHSRVVRHHNVGSAQEG